MDVMLPAVYTFRTAAGRTVTVIDPIPDADPHDLGHKVNLSYRPGEPEHARVVRGWTGWTALPILFIAAGVTAFGALGYAL